MADRLLLENGSGSLLLEDGVSFLLLEDGALMSVVADRVLDLGLNVLADEADKIYLCSDEPTTYAEAVGISPGYALAVKDFGSPGGAFGPASSTVSPDAPGRYVASTAILDGSVIRSGTAAWWAAVDSANARLLVRGPVNTSNSITASGTFSLPSFKLRRPGQ